MKKLIIYLLLLLALPTSLCAQYKVGTGGDYPTLKDAFDDINNGYIQGDITLEIISSINDNNSAVLYQSGWSDGLSYYPSLIIYPGAAGYTLSGNVAGPLIDLNGASNVTLDGRVDLTGSTKSLTITNTNTGSSASTIRLIESASSNVINYCIIKGAETNATGGVIFFSTSSTGDGNNGNIINLNDITSDPAGRPLNAIYSSGTSGAENSGNTISNNNFYNFLNKGTASNGIYLYSGTITWTISGNSFYETSSFVPTASVAYNDININNTSGTGFVISGNFFGGSSASCGGSARTKTSAYDNIYNAVYLNAGTGTASDIQNNTIQNFSWANSGSAAWTGINIAGGDVNIGTTGANNIGASTGKGSITITGGATGMIVTGINITGSGIISCQNNNIGSFTVANTDPTLASSFYGISKNGTAGTTTFSNNTIGSNSTSNSVNATSTSSLNAQTVIGISTAGSGTININNNTVANLANGTTSSGSTTRGLINGISSSSGTNTITGNTIHDLTIANANNNLLNGASVIGILLTGNTSSKTITGNIIYNLSNTYASSSSGGVIGLYFQGSTGANAVSGNFIYGLSVSGPNTVNGIKINAGVCTYSNNIITLGGNTATSIFGIFENGAAGNNNNCYFNTIYIGGSPTSGSLISYAFYSSVTSNTKNFRNNLFFNNRSNSGSASGKHYAVRVANNTNLTIDYNDYWAPNTGAGGVLGSFNGLDKTTLAAWQAATGQDVHSLNIDPTFVNPGSIVATDYKIVSASLPGVLGTGITVDYGLNPRGTSSVVMGSWESVINKWIGTTSTDWATTTNWTGGVIPAADANIYFADSPLNHCLLDQDRSVTNITNAQSVYRLMTNGHNLTIKGNMYFTNGAQIDASSASSTITFAGSAAQSVPSGAFYNNQVYNLTVNNANNVTFNGNMNLLGTLTATSGRLDAVTNSPSITYGGSSAQTIEANSFLSNTAYNLTDANASGVTLNTNFAVNNSLTINSGAIFTISAPNILTVPGTITNNAGNAGLVIKSVAEGNDGKLIYNNSSVNGTVELYLSGGVVASGAARFHYFVPPVTSMYIGNNIANVKTNLGLTNFNGDLVSYSESAAGSNKDNGWQYFDGYNSTTPFSSLSSSNGYNIYLTADDKITFTGTINASAQTFSSLSYTNLGWNLIGNPYPCDYNLTGISALINTGDNVDNTVYFNHDGGYAYWNVETGAGTTGFSSVVAPMQGFFVHVTGTGTSLSLPVTSKTASAALPLRSKKGEFIPSKGAPLVRKIKLVLNDGVVPDETIVCVIDDATTNFDGDYDAYKLFGSGTSTPFIYSELNSVQYAINSVPEPDSSYEIIPVTVVIKTAGTYEIDITEFENLGDLPVILKHGDDKTNLSQGASYTFASAAGTFTDFQLIIGNYNIETGVETLTQDKLKTWYSNYYMYINCPSEISSGKGSLNIYDIQGKIVYSDNPFIITAGQTVQLPINLPKGVYIVRLIVNNQPFISKIVVV